MNTMKNRRNRDRSNTRFLLVFLMLIAVCAGAFGFPGPAQAAVKAKSISISQTAYALKVGKSVKLTATITPSGADQNVKWTSSKKKVAVINSKGKVTAKKAGTTKITAAAKDGSGKKASLKVKVVKKLTKVKSVTITNQTKKLATGEKLSITTTVLPKKATLTTLKYTSSDETVATVSKSGVVTAKQPGKAKITAQAQDGSKKKAVVTVTVTDNPPTEEKVTVVTLTGDDLYLQGADGQYTWMTYVGRTKTLMAKVEPETASDKTLTWSSSDDAVVTVSQGGVLVGKKEGTAEISVTANDTGSVMAVCTVTVGPAETLANYEIEGDILHSNLCFKLNYRDTTSFRIENSADNSVKSVKNSDMVLATMRIGDIAKTSADGAEAFYNLLLQMKDKNSVIDSFINFGEIESVEWDKTANTIIYTTKKGDSTRTVVCDIQHTSEGLELWENDAYVLHDSKNVTFQMGSGSARKYYVLVALMPNGSFVYKVSNFDIVDQRTTKPYIQMLVKTGEEGEQSLDLRVDSVLNAEISSSYAAFTDFSKLTMYNVYSDIR